MLDYECLKFTFASFSNPSTQFMVGVGKSLFCSILTILLKCGTVLTFDGLSIVKAVLPFELTRTCFCTKLFCYYQISDRNESKISFHYNIIFEFFIVTL